MPLPPWRLPQPPDESEAQWRSTMPDPLRGSPLSCLAVWLSVAVSSPLFWAVAELFRALFCSCIERGARKPCVETIALPPNSCLSWFTLLNPPVLLSPSVKWGYAVPGSSVTFEWYNTYKVPDTEKALTKRWFSLATSHGGGTGVCLSCKAMFCSPRLMETFLYRYSPLSSLYSLRWWHG